MNIKSFMLDFMGIFFVVFSFFKLLNLKGFQNSFKKYDLIGKQFNLYCWLYPFIEIVIGIFLIQQQMGDWPSAGDMVMFVASTGLLLWWYTCLQLLASSMARDIGSSVTLGVGTWLFFVFLWLIPTLIVAQTMGVDITDPNSVGFDRIQEKVDLFSPNGVYQLMMETRLSGESQPNLSNASIWAAASLWFVIPTNLFVRRIKTLRA